MHYSFRCTATVISKYTSADTLNGAFAFANGPKTDITTPLRASVPKKVWSRVYRAGGKIGARSQGTTKEKGEMWSGLIVACPGGLGPILCAPSTIDVDNLKNI